MQLLTADTASHRIALATLLSVEAATLPHRDIVRNGIALVDPALGLLAVSEAISVVASLPKPLECWGEANEMASAPLRLQCIPLVDAAAEGFRRWYSAWLHGHTLSVAKQLGPQGHICIRGDAVGNHAVLLTGEEYQLWRLDYKIPDAWSISTDLDSDAQALGAKAVFTIRSSGVKGMLVREELLPGEEQRDLSELAQERIRRIEKAIAEIAAALPPDLPPDERNARIEAELKTRLNQQGFAGL